MHEKMFAAFKDLLQRGDLPGDEYSMEHIYALRTLKVPILDLELSEDTAYSELVKLLKSRKRVLFD